MPDTDYEPTPVIGSPHSKAAASFGLLEGPEIHPQEKGESLHAAALPEPTSDQPQQFPYFLQRIEQRFSEFREELKRIDQAVERFGGGLKDVEESLGKIHQYRCR